ncbi:unnamed protein product [Sphagnum tenellum]
MNDEEKGHGGAREQEQLDFSFDLVAPAAVDPDCGALKKYCADEILKLATFQTGNGEDAVGVVHGDTIWHLQDVVKLPQSILPAQLSDMVGVIQHWDLLKNRCSFPVMWWIQGGLRGC